MRFTISFLHLTPLVLFLLRLLLPSTDMAAAAMPGGIYDSPVSVAENNLEIENLGRFAVSEHNKKQNAILEFARVVKAQEQVVAGKLHHLTVEAIGGGKKRLYHAKVWVKPWMNFRELQEFNYVGDSPSAIAHSDLGAKRGGHEKGWKDVPADDPEILNAAQHALRTIQQRSNSLLPYELQEVTHAKAEVVDDTAKFNLILRVTRGKKEENFNVEVHKNNEGSFLLNQFAEHNPAA